ncbi:MAG: hypothetical protein H6733_13790 [Alphaproteobacteria bacterium]|nr:hypothetical protein [Alphaproteobacteria bacterium]
MKTWILAALVGVSAAVLPAPAEACSCLPFDFVRSYRQNDHVFAGRVTNQRHVGSWLIYDVFVMQDLKSCMPEHITVQVGTPDQQVACGTNLLVGGTYVIFASDTRVAGQTVMVTTYCSEPQRLSALTRADKAFLRDRPHACGTGCVDGSFPFSCFADPCSLTSSCSSNAACEANFCGGCTAEFYTPFDEAACLPW